MKLWLDDERPMPAGFDVHAKTAQEAIERIARGDITEVSLDHDLGKTEPCSDGYWVARWIEHAAMNGLLKKLAWTIHSQNPVGAANMQTALTRADRAWKQASTGAIRDFSGVYAFLSTLHVYPFSYEEVQYMSVENAFWSKRSKEVECREKIKSAQPDRAEDVAMSIPAGCVDPHFENRSYQVDLMRAILYSKFQDGNLRVCMENLGERQIRPVLKRGADRFWGCGPDGDDTMHENHLGNILYEIKHKILAGLEF